MRYVIIALLFLMVMACQNKENKDSFTPEFLKAEIIPTKIDSLDSERDVQSFVNQLRYPFYVRKITEDSIIVHHMFKEFELKKIKDFNRNCKSDTIDRDQLSKKIADSLKIEKSYYKSDFDNNGFTDLLIIGDRHNCGKGCSGSDWISCDFSVYALMSFQEDSIQPIDLNSISKSLSLVPRIVENHKGVFIELYKPEDYQIIDGEFKKVNHVVPVAYKYGTFIEHNDNANDYTIESIEFTAQGCVAGCPEFIISIDKNQKGTLNAINYNWFDKNFSNDLELDDVKGIYTTQISDKHFNELLGIIKYLDVPNLANAYNSGAMHSSSVILNITYNDGNVKTIRDDGLIGTYGLKRLYDMFYALRFNQDWK